MIRRPPRSTLDRSSAASDVYKRQLFADALEQGADAGLMHLAAQEVVAGPQAGDMGGGVTLSLIHISEPTRPY